MYKTVQINCFTKVFYVTAYPCVSTSVTLTYVWAFGFAGCILFFKKEIVEGSSLWCWLMASASGWGPCRGRKIRLLMSTPVRGSGFEMTGEGCGFLFEDNMKQNRKPLLADLLKSRWGNQAMQKVVARPAEGETLDGKLRFIVKSAMPQIVERRAAGWRLQILKPATHSVAERPKEGDIYIMAPAMAQVVKGRGGGKIDNEASNEKGEGMWKGNMHVSGCRALGAYMWATCV